jgi:hypothetical protein
MQALAQPGAMNLKDVGTRDKPGHDGGSPPQNLLVIEIA